MANAGLLDVVIAPLVLLERTRGWRRRGLIVAYLLFASTVGVLIYRMASLWKLPDIGEPFDVAKYGSVKVAEADNAIPLYIAAEERLNPRGKELQFLPYKSWEVRDWAKLDPQIRAWVESNGQALDLWLQAVERPEALEVQPSEVTIRTFFRGAQAIRNLSQPATLEAVRRQHAGDLAGAWTILRGLLRSSRHAGLHGETTQRLGGYSVLKKSDPVIKAWVDDPAVTPDLLRRAILDVEACLAMTPPTSDVVRNEYFSTRDLLDHPDQWPNMTDRGDETRLNWINQLPYGAEGRHFLAREPERSHRIHRLITLGVLAQIDRPRGSRPRLIAENRMIYDVDARTPPILAAMTPSELSAWADRSAFSSLVNGDDRLLMLFDLEPGLLDGLRIRMAERAYAIEKGHPARTYGELVGPYLKTLPEGIEPDYPVGATP